MKRSRAADEISKVSSRSTRLRSANTSRCGKRYLAVEGLHAALGHHAQQQRVHLRPRAIDLVEEEDRELLAVADQRPGLDRRAAVGVDVRVVDEVGRHQVDRALDARERAAEHPREAHAAASSCRRRRHPAAARARGRTLQWSRAGSRAPGRLPPWRLRAPAPARARVRRPGGPRLHPCRLLGGGRWIGAMVPDRHRCLAPSGCMARRSAGRRGTRTQPVDPNTLNGIAAAGNPMNRGSGNQHGLRDLQPHHLERQPAVEHGRGKPCR